MRTRITKTFDLVIPKLYLVVYSIVALPMAYYGFSYIRFIKNNMGIVLPLFGLVMAASVAAALLSHLRVGRAIRPLISREPEATEPAGQEEALRKLGRYPIRLVIIMTTGWTLLLNLAVFLPAILFLEASIFDLAICNMLVFACAFMSTPITWFIADNGISSLLELPSFEGRRADCRALRFPLTAKMLIVCLIIMISLILNTIAALMISMSLNLSIEATMVNVLIISALGIVDTLVVALIFARSMKKPLENLRRGAGDLKAGSLLTKIPCLSNDELGDSSHAFNDVVIKLGQIVFDIQGSVEATVRHVAELSSAMKDTDNSTVEIDRRMEGMQGAIASQSACIGEVSSTIRQITHTIENQDERINEQSRSVSESSSAIEQMIANIKSIAATLERSSREFEGLQAAIRSGNKNVDELQANVTVLRKQSDSVFEANAIIKNISAQTNLLAMNAAIEAAHAGDSGRGFAVVADEIRKLAEVSNQQSKVISESLKVLKQSIDKAVSMTGETGTSFSSIIRSVETVNTLELEIKHAIEEQSSGSAQILHALTTMNDITAEVHSGSREMLDGSHRIDEELAKLLDLTNTVTEAGKGVALKAHGVKMRSRNALDLLSRTAGNMEQIEGQVGFFTVEKRTDR